MTGPSFARSASTVKRPWPTAHPAWQTLLVNVPVAGYVTMSDALCATMSGRFPTLAIALQKSSILHQPRPPHPCRSRTSPFSWMAGGTSAQKAVERAT